MDINTPNVNFVPRPLPAFAKLGTTKVGRNLESKLATQLHKWHKWHKCSAKLTDVIPVFLNTAGFPYTVWRRIENGRLRIRENEK